MTNIGYTHSMFSGNLRTYAQKVDRDTANGGNNNGMLDGKEIEMFKAAIKKDTGYDFSFDGIKQSTAKQVQIRDKDNYWIYNTATELAEKYRENGASSKAIIGLNGGDPFAKNKNSSAVVPYMTADEFKSSEELVDKQEAEVSTRLAKKREEQKAKDKKEMNEASKSTLEKAWDWFIGLFPSGKD